MSLSLEAIAVLGTSRRRALIILNHPAQDSMYHTWKAVKGFCLPLRHRLGRWSNLTPMFVFHLPWGFLFLLFCQKLTSTCMPTKVRTSRHATL